MSISKSRWGEELPSELPPPVPGDPEQAAKAFSGIPGLQFLDASQPSHPWSTAFHGFEVLSDVEIDPDGPEVIPWLKQALSAEGIQGDYFFASHFVLFGGYGWVRLNLEPDYAWSGALWNLSRGQLHFTSVDETYSVEISSQEWSHRVRVKRRVETKTLPEYFDPHTSPLTKLKPTDTTHALSADTGLDAYLWRVKDKRLLRFFRGFGPYVSGIKLSRDLMVSNPDSMTLHLWSLSTGEIVRRFKQYKDIFIGKIAAIDSHTILSTFYERDRGIGLWNVNSGELDRLFGRGVIVEDIVLVDKRHLVIACASDLQVYDISTGQVIRSLKGHEKVVKAVVKTSPDNVLSCSSDKTVRLWNIKTGESRRILETDYPIYGIEKTGDNLLTISGTLLYPQEYRLDLWDYKTGILLGTLPIKAPGYVPRYLDMLDQETIIVDFYDDVLLVRIGNNEHDQILLIPIRDLRGEGGDATQYIPID